MGYLEEMAPFARAFAAHFAVLSFDHPGMKGSSPMVFATPERLARALDAMVEQAFGDAPVAIYGVSLGAVVGALIARAKPSRVRALIFDDPVFAPADFAGIANYAAELVRGVPPDSPALAGFAEFTGFDPHTLQSDGSDLTEFLHQAE
jgi:pimeloyl-ACP methyl ester carboxylesterase